MVRWLYPLALLLLAGVALAQTKKPVAEPQDGDSMIRLTTDLVVVDTQVTQQLNGKIIGGLQATDFIVEEDGVRQEIEHFSQDKLPLSVILLFDLTDTVQPVLKQLARGALQALQHFKPEDELAVLAYSDRTVLMQDFTRDRRAVVEAIESASRMSAPQQLALFNEAVWQAAEHMQKQAKPQRRRLLLWLTDNLPNKPPKSAHTEEEAFAQLFENDIAVFGIMMQSAGGKMLNFLNLFMKNAGDIFKYAERTGGEVIKAEKEHVDQRVAEMIDRVRARYTLGYISGNTSQDGKFHRIKVRVTPEVEQREGKLVLRGKAGYFAKTRVN
jgi:VWFA-related protein